MNPQTPVEAREIFSALKRIAKDFKKTELVICPPFIYLPILLTFNFKLSNLKIGAQDVFWENPQANKGAFTGEISSEMLKNLGVTHIILGHSERRTMGETDEMVNKKIKASLRSKLTPILCVGEKKRDTDGRFFEFLKNQIKSAFSKIKKADLSKVIIAYEPIWAIGKSEKEYMRGEELYQMVIFIRKTLSDIYGKKEVWKPKIIYGGSVTAFNISDIVFQGQVDGILPGRASLNPKEMKEIMKILETAR